MQTLLQRSETVAPNTLIMPSYSGSVGWQWLLAPLFGLLCSVSLLCLSFPALLDAGLQSALAFGASLWDGVTTLSPLQKEFFFPLDSLSDIKLGSEADKGITQALMSPFQTVVVSFAGGSLALIGSSFKGLRHMPPPSFWFLFRSAISGLLLLFGLFFVVAGLQASQNLLGPSLLISFIPVASLLGRKLIWNETLNRHQLAGVLVSLCCVMAWLLISPQSSLRHGIAIASWNDAKLINNTFVFVGSLLIGLCISLAKPAATKAPVGMHWLFTVLFGLFASFPIMLTTHFFIYGGTAPDRGLLAAFVTAGSFSSGVSLSGVVAALLFGTVQLALRGVWLRKLACHYSAGVSSLLWTAGLLTFSAFFSGLINETLSLWMLLLLPLQLVGIALLRDALFPWQPFLGIREILPSQLHN